MTHRKLLLLGTVLALSLQLFAGIAAADVAFTTSDYAGGTLGIVANVSGDLAVTQNRATNVGSDTIAFGYAFGDKLLVTDRSSTGTADDGIRIYNPSDLSSPLVKTTWAGARNIYDAEYLFGYLYVICYTDGRIVKVETKDFTKVGEYRFDDNILPTGYTAKGVSLAQLGGQLYALFAVSDSSFPPNYQPSRLVKLGDDLTQLAGMQLPENAHTLATFNNQLYVASWGGAQNDKADASKSTLQVINTSVMGESEIFNGSDIDGAQIAAICFGPDGSMLVATHKYDANFNTLVRVYRISPGLVASTKQLLKTLDGWSTTIIYDSVTRCFWVANASGQNGPNQLMAFDRSNGNLVKSFSATDLGGPAYFATSVKQTSSAPTPGGDGSGGGGCSAGTFGAAGLFLISTLFAIRRRNG